jgi:hypothetical protein
MQNDSEKETIYFDTLAKERKRERERGVENDQENRKQKEDTDIISLNQKLKVICWFESKNFHYPFKCRNGNTHEMISIKVCFIVLTFLFERLIAKKQTRFKYQNVGGI